MDDLQLIDRAFWRGVGVRQGEAFERYGHALAVYAKEGQGAELVLRDAFALSAGMAADLIAGTLQVGWAYQRWTWSVLGLRVLSVNPPDAVASTGRAPR